MLGVLGMQDEKEDYIQCSALLPHVSQSFFVIYYTVLSSKPFISIVDCSIVEFKVHICELSSEWIGQASRQRSAKAERKAQVGIWE